MLLRLRPAVLLTVVLAFGLAMALNLSSLDGSGHFSSCRSPPLRLVEGKSESNAIVASMDTALWLTRTRAKAARLACPDCGVKSAVPIVWGLPVSDLATPWEQGLLELGGCAPPPEPVPEWMCRACRFVWSLTLPKEGYRPAPEQGEWEFRLVPGAARCCTEEEVARAIEDLDESPHRIRARDWPGDLVGLGSPGLYAWWVDKDGTGDLGRGLGTSVRAGRIYVGQAGATRWPSGTPSMATLGSRIPNQHLRGNIYGSTFRLTFASVLRDPLSLRPLGGKKMDRTSEDSLSAWLLAHLEVAVHPFARPSALEDLEDRVLGRLDPPLNLGGVSANRARIRLSELRTSFTRP